MKGYRGLALGLIVTLPFAACSADDGIPIQEPSSTSTEVASTASTEGVTQTTFDVPSLPATSNAPPQPDFPSPKEAVATMEPNDGAYFDLITAAGADEIELL